VSTETTETAATSTETTNSETAAGATTQEARDEFLDRTIGENAKYRAKNAEYAKRIKELETDAQELATVKEQLPKIEQAARERVAKAEFRALLKSSGITDPDVLKLAPLEKVEYDGEGDPTNIDAIWTEFQEAKPYLFGTKKAVSTTSERKAPKPEQDEADVAEMSDEEFEAHRKAIRESARNR
jgi:hypothetical protein